MVREQPEMTVLDPQTFAASTLTSREGLTTALTILESCLVGPEMSLDLIIQDLCSVPNLFEFILSAWSNAGQMVHRILNTYPTDPALVQASSSTILLQRISSVMFALPPSLLPSETVRRIGGHKTYVEGALPVLTLLCSTDFSTCVTTGTMPASVLEDPEYDNVEYLGFFERTKKQKRLKQKTKNTGPNIDLTPFHKLGAQVPMTNVHALQMAHEITDHLKMILKFYLELLLEPFLAQHLRDAYVSTNDETAIRPSAPQEKKIMQAVEQKLSVYPKVQPMKAALYFENADGFGEWRIIIGTGATKKLRELANGDRKKCAIVVKKIKQLSNGHFSDENQKRLNTSSGIPIFEAKMQRDLRLVYQIDVIPDHDGKQMERQVIKIHGICTHSQLNRIWDVVGQHLVGKGKEYRRRCIFRSRPVHAGSDVYLPACFPPEDSQNDTKLMPLVLSDEDMGELHSLLVLEKFVTFSQAYLHSLIVNQDVQHVFELSTQEHRIAECMTSCYVLGRSGTGKTTTMLFKMLGIQRAWEMQMSRMPKPRQIFVTKSPVLATKVEEYFTKLLESLALARYSREQLKEMQAPKLKLVDADDEDRVDIPKKYSALEENHFPLFVTFDKLARMIAADVFSATDAKVQRFAKFFIDVNEIEVQDSFVTYDVFARTYWPHFPQLLTKGLEPWLVFSEFMGIIKGSEGSLSCPNGFLGKEAYCGLPARSNPTFANQRHILYAIFETYCRLKKERGHHDVADRTHAILRTLLGGTPFKGQRVDYLYIDEAQDNLLIDALLLRLICRNPEGLFWAGDTAQTISAGSSFRFNDLKAFLYRIELDQSTHLIQDRSVTDPMAFQLAINYRSHGGIVNCAHSVIERITQFWPDAIDGLQAEHGIVDGVKPVFFRGWDQDTVRYEQFLFGESGSRIEFGAQQCILVRDDEALNKLRMEVGDIGSVMTLYDSKGLEFNDVLLYNFFEDSAVDAPRWRVLLNHAEGEVDGQDLVKVHAPSFERDEGRFSVVCNELKLLYVGITRARKNLWIFDKSDKSEPMRMIWTSRNQVQNCTPGTDVPHLAVSSTPAEWESFGHDLFNHKRYTQAMHCFDRASLPRMVAICEAFHLREVARAKVGVAPEKVQQDAFLTAADAFKTSGDDAPLGKEKFQYYRNAADCYVRAGKDRKAAIEYLSAQAYDLAAGRFRKAGLFDETLEVLHNYSERFPLETLEELYTVCRLFYCRKHDGNRPRFPLFPSFEEELEFYENYDLDFARATLLESHGRYLEAAELHLIENRPLDAIRDLLKERESRDAIQKATKVLLDGLWHRCSFAIPSKEVAADRDVSELLKMASELTPNSLDPSDLDEISMFHAIVQADSTGLKNLSHVFIKESKNAAALLTLDHFFSRLPVLRSYKLQEMSQFLEQFRQYSRLLFQVISHPDPLSVNSIKRLFCIKELSNIEYGLEPRSFLHSSVTGDDHRSTYLRPSIVALPKRDMVAVLRKYLTKYLCEQVDRENMLCYDAVVFSPCLTYIVTENCNRANCPFDHINLANLDAKYYNTRIGIHLQQMCILQNMYSACPGLVRRKCVVDWLVHLYEAINPEFHIQGSIANLDLSIIPGAIEGRGVMKHWIWEALHVLSVDHDPSGFLTTVLKLTSLLFIFDKTSALKCINQAPFVTRHSKPQEFMYPDGGYIIEDVLNLFNGVMQTSISAGVKFLCHILKTSLIVNLAVFCDCFEEVVGKISVSWRLSFDPPLDGLVLPRSWLSNKDFSARKETKIVFLVDLLDRMRDLLMFLQSDSAGDTYRLSDTRLTPILCNVITSRICRALCLLAYNVRNSEVISSVEKTLKALQTTGPMQRAHFLYRPYTSAARNEYLKASVAFDELKGVIICDLVRLLHNRGTIRRVPRLRRFTDIHYENPTDIPSLVVPQLVKARSNLRAEALAFVPQAYSSQTKAAEEPGVEESLPEELEVEPVDEIYEEPQDLPPIMDEPALIHAHEPTKEEILAAETIQAAYRTYCKRRKAQARAVGSGLRARRNMVFVSCLKNVYTSNWPKTSYRTLYLWVLPHLVVCLDQIIDVAYKLKSKAKGQILKESHEHLEELGKEMSKMNALLKEGRNLRKKIEPDAAMHREKDNDKMKEAFLDVKDLALRHRDLDREIEGSLDIVYGLVMAEEQRIRKVEKPTLNTEDV